MPTREFCTTSLVKSKPTLAASLIFLAISAACQPAVATEGFLQNGIGARQKALAGAGAADSRDATAAALNPAGLVDVGTQITGAVSIMKLRGGFTSTGVGGLDPDGSFRNEGDLVVVPNFAANWRVNWGFANSIAFTVYGNGGVSTHYGNFANGNCPPGLSGVYCGGTMGVKLEQSIVSVAFAKALTPEVSVGVAPMIAYQTGRVDGVSFFGPFSSDPTHFTNQGVDEAWGAGVRGGIEFKAAPGVRLGLSGNTQIAMTGFDKYRGLLAEQGRVDVPATMQAGIAIDVRPNFTLMLDYKRIWFGNNPAVANPSTNLLLGNQFGAANGPGYGLKDVDVFKVGIEGSVSKDLVLRAGYSYNTAPLGSRDADFNIMTLGVIQHHLATGLKYAVARNLDLELSAMYAPKSSLTGVELGVPSRNVEIRNSEIEMSVGLIYRFDTPGTPLK